MTTNKTQPGAAAPRNTGGPLDRPPSHDGKYRIASAMERQAAMKAKALPPLQRLTAHTPGPRRTYPGIARAMAAQWGAA